MGASYSDHLLGTVDKTAGAPFFLTHKAQFGSRPEAFPDLETPGNTSFANTIGFLDIAADCAAGATTATKLGRFTRGPHVPKGRGAVLK